MSDIIAPDWISAKVKPSRFVFVSGIEVSCFRCGAVETLEIQLHACQTTDRRDRNAITVSVPVSDVESALDPHLQRVKDWMQVHHKCEPSSPCVVLIVTPENSYVYEVQWGNVYPVGYTLEEFRERYPAPRGMAQICDSLDELPPIIASLA